MKLYLTNRSNSYKAFAEYDIETQQFVVKKGSRVSKDIAYSASFRGSKSIEKSRASFVSLGEVTEDVVFKSPSTAANFITGRSSNGMIMWKDESGKTLKEILSN